MPLKLKKKKRKQEMQAFDQHILTHFEAEIHVAKITFTRAPFHYLRVELNSQVNSKKTTD